MNITVDYILESVCKEFSVTQEQVKNKSRKAEIVLCRYVVMYFLDKYLILDSKRLIGQVVNLDHASAIYGIKKIHTILVNEKNFKQRLQSLDYLCFKDKNEKCPCCGRSNK